MNPQTLGGRVSPTAKGTERSPLNTCDSWAIKPGIGKPRKDAQVRLGMRPLEAFPWKQVQGWGNRQATWAAPPSPGDGMSQAPAWSRANPGWGFFKRHCCGLYCFPPKFVCPSRNSQSECIWRWVFKEVLKVKRGEAQIVEGWCPWERRGCWRTKRRQPSGSQGERPLQKPPPMPP